MADEKSDNPFAPPEASLEVPRPLEPAEPPVAEPETVLPISAEDRVLLGSTSTLIEAETIASALRGQGIRVAFADHQTVAAHSIIGGAIGGVRIYTSKEDLPRAEELLSKQAGAGKPVFIVKRKPVGMILVGLLGGALIGSVLAAIVEFPAAFVVGMIVGGLLGARARGAIYCSSPRCGSPMEVDAKICPGCGGVVAGIIGHPDERLEAEERLRSSD